MLPTMKLLQIDAPGQAVWRDVPRPEPGPGEVLVQVSGVTTCPQWDLHIFGGEPMFADRPLAYPYVPGEPGHEFAGDVADVGRLVTDVRVGDRVTAEGHIVDGRCLLCRTGNAHVCPFTRIIGVDRDGCFAEYIAMPAVNVWHLDANVGGVPPCGEALPA